MPTPTATRTATTWTPISNAETRRAAARLEKWLADPGYTVLGCYQRSDAVISPDMAVIAVVYTDFAESGAFAVSLADAMDAEDFTSYSEWCNSTHDLADAALASLVAEESGRRLKSGSAYVLEDVVDADDP